MSLPTASDGKVVGIKYTLKNDAGEVIDHNDSDPLPYLHGVGQIVPGLEQALTGRTAGEVVDAVIEPADAYGVGGLPSFDVPRSAFPEGAELELGLQVVGQDDQGHPVPYWIAGFTDESVTLDPNHPLAGQRLHFHVEIVSVRDATTEELAHGHAHGPGGAHDH